MTFIISPENNQAVFSLPVLLGKSKKSVQQTRDLMAHARLHLALLEFQLMLQELDKAWPEEAVTIRLKPHKNSDLGRLHLHYKTARPDPTELDFDFLNDYRTKMEDLCEHFSPEWEALVKEGFGEGKHDVARHELPGRLKMALASRPELQTAVTAVNLSKRLASAPHARQSRL